MKRKKLVLLISFCVLAGYTSCIKEFIPRVDKYDQLLVVEGAITDQPGPYTIKLSISVKLSESSRYIPYSKCTVEISDDTGNSEMLTEVSEGVYKTDSLGMQGVVGRKYKLKISAPDDQVYESQEEILKKGVGIQSLSAEYERKNDRDGYQFYVDAENYSTADSNYLFWSLESTYKFKTDHKIFFYYEGGIAPAAIKPFPNPDSLQICYRTQPIIGIYTFDPLEQNQSQAIHFPLNYEDTYSNALAMRYCLTVKQYTFTKKQYTYWSTVKKMNASQGSLYSQQPYQVKGNVINLSDPEKPVLGYFMVGGLSQKRIFVDHLPLGLYEYSTCLLPEPSKVPLYKRLNATTQQDWPIYIVGTFMVGLDIDAECADCRAAGFLQKPDFWIE